MNTIKGPVTNVLTNNESITGNTLKNYRLWKQRLISEYLSLSCLTLPMTPFVTHTSLLSSFQIVSCNIVHLT